MKNTTHIYIIISSILFIFTGCSLKNQNQNLYNFNKFEKNNIYKNEVHTNFKLDNYDYIFQLPKSLKDKLDTYNNLKYKTIYESKYNKLILLNLNNNSIENLNIKTKEKLKKIKKVCLKIFKDNKYINECLKDYKLKKNQYLVFPNKFINLINQREKDEIGVSLANKTPFNIENINVLYSQKNVEKEIIKYNLMFYIQDKHMKENLIREICKKDENLCREIIKEERFFKVYEFPKKSITKLPEDLDIKYTLDNFETIYKTKIYKTQNGNFINLNERKIPENLIKDYYNYMKNINYNIQK